MLLKSNCESKTRRPSRASRAFELLEGRVMLAAHVVGDATSYATIQAAVNAAAAGAVIRVDSGNYAELVTIAKPLTLQGAQRGIDGRAAARGKAGTETVVTGINTGNGISTVFYINADNVTLDGFTIQGTTDNNKSGGGIVIAPNRSGTHVLNNVIQNNFTGLYLANSSATNPAVIQHNLFLNNDNNPKNLSWDFNGSRGIYTDSSLSGGLLQNVQIDGNSFIINNRANDPWEGAIALEGKAPNSQTNISITNNTMTGVGKGVLIYNATHITIRGNTITNAYDDSGTLRFEGNVQNVVIEYNNIHDNMGWAVHIDCRAVPGDSAGFVIRNNTFYNNNLRYNPKQSLYVNQGLYDGPLDATNNYWGASTGPSGDGKGKGDAVTSAGNSITFSPWATAATVPVAMPSAPTNLAAAAGSSRVTLTWQNAPGTQTQYEIDRSSDGVTFSTLALVDASANSYVDATVSSTGSWYYRVCATNATGSSAFTAVVKSGGLPSSTTNLSTLAWTSATAGWGTVQKDATIKGNAIKLRGMSYASGLGTHAGSTIVYSLGGQYASFVSDVGLDDEVGGQGSVYFQVIGDGKVLYDSGVLTGKSPVAYIAISVAGVQQLTLIAMNSVPGNIDFDHADWAGAKLLTTPVTPTAPSAPTGLAATPISGAQVDLTWTNTAANQTGVKVQRSSTGGASYTLLATLGAGATGYSDTGLSPSTTYTYRVLATNAAGDSASSNIVTVKTKAASAIYLSDLTPLSATAGWNSVQQDASIKGNPLSLRGVVYGKGIGTHAPSTIVYALGGSYGTFTAAVGIDDETGGQGAAIFQVIGDGKVLYDSGVLTGASAAAFVNVDVTGIQKLTLVVNPGISGTIDYDHADWAAAQLFVANA